MSTFRTKLQGKHNVKLESQDFPRSLSGFHTLSAWGSFLETFELQNICYLFIRGASRSASF